MRSQPSVIVNLGSINIDHVYDVAHFVRGGETIGAREFSLGLGGKGLNQSVALARAGGRVRHIGKVGADGRWAVDRLRDEGVDVERVIVGDGATGHAIIQRTLEGENAIIVFGGANHQLTTAAVIGALGECQSGDWLLAQNETNLIDVAVQEAKHRSLRVCLNPAPMSPAVADWPLQGVDLLIVNTSEAEALTHEQDPHRACADLAHRTGGGVVVTLGAHGALWQCGSERIHVKAHRVQAVDTTAAGDTFVGYFLASFSAGLPVDQALQRASRAAAICVTRPGAVDAVPGGAEVDAWSGFSGGA